MDWLKTLAPTIATVLGGPLAGMAVQAIGSAMGMTDATGERINEVLTSGNMTSEQVAALKQAELALKARLSELQIKPEEIAAADRASARQMQATVRSKIPGALAILITLGFFGILLGMMTGDLKSTGNTEALLIMLGALGAAWGAVVNFYYGSSAGSASKNELLAKKAG
jgi:hypothetical protein